MGFGWPLGLAALAALLVPVLIHLARRRPRRPVLVGTLRHLPPAAAPKRARSQVTEPWLLALRMLLLALLALVVAQPFADGSRPSAAPRSLLVLPAGLPDDSLRTLVPAADSLLAAGLELRRLPMADLWSELAELDAEIPRGSSIAVAAPLELPVAGTRPALRSAVTMYRFERPRGTAPLDTASRTLHVRVFADSATRIAALRHAAAFRAVAELRGDSLVLDGPATSDGWIVWLPDSAPPPAVLEDVRAGATLLRSYGEQPRPADVIEAEPIGRGRIFRASAVGNPAVDAAFPELIARIWPDPTPLSAPEPSLRRIATSQLLPALTSTSERAGTPRTPLGRMFVGVALALFLLERWLSHRPMRAPAPRTPAT